MAEAHRTFPGWETNEARPPWPLEGLQKGLSPPRTLRSAPHYPLCGNRIRRIGCDLQIWVHLSDEHQQSIDKF